MLKLLFHTELSLGLAQAVVVAITAILVAILASRRGAPMQREIPLALLRGLVQILLIGFLLAVLLRGPWWTALPLLVGMILMAANIVRRRAREIPETYTLSLICLAAGAGVVIAVMTLLGIITPDIRMLVPVGSMVIAQNMNIQSLFLNRFLGELRSHTGEIESALALGASTDTAVSPYLRAAFHASLIPATDNLRSLGIVWIPGIMAGMILSGSSPVYAALYQFVILSMIFTAGGLSCLTATYLVPRRVFTHNQQLRIRG
ncbi:MAG TPA: ABC transporter permease [Acidobacteriaceae bacterium]|jgi:putative ABC transport system permease protein|nr:ABC transporter permease [Acidobacteriaceae bacterium]